MNYNKIYNDLIEKARNRVSIDGYYEVHHIIPKCLNGNDEPSNLVKLTAREHFIAHLLLANIHGGLCLYAAYFMYGFKKYTNKGSSWIKEDAIKLLASTKKRSVSQYSKDNVFIKIWDSVSEAKTELMISHIDHCARGGRQSAGGYIWKYNTDQIHKPKKYKKRENTNLKNRRPVQCF